MIKHNSKSQQLDNNLETEGVPTKAAYSRHNDKRCKHLLHVCIILHNCQVQACDCDQKCLQASVPCYLHGKWHRLRKR
jgi:hypothetical protein